MRRKWRLRSLLREATGLQPERIGLAHVRLDSALGVISMQRAALDLDGQELILHFWPGELKRQAEHLYGAGHAERLVELPPGDTARRGRWRQWRQRSGESGRRRWRPRGQRGCWGGWRVEPQPQLGFRNAPARTRVYLTSRLDAATYIRRWQTEDFKQVGAHNPDTILPELWPWLLRRRYASARDKARVEPFLRTLGRRAAHLRPSIHVSRWWPFEHAVALDDEGLLAGEIHDAINRVLDLLEEPLIILPSEQAAQTSEGRTSRAALLSENAQRHEPPPQTAGAAARRG